MCDTLPQSVLSLVCFQILACCAMSRSLSPVNSSVKTIQISISLHNLIFCVLHTFHIEFSQLKMKRTLIFSRFTGNDFWKTLKKFFFFIGVVCNKFLLILLFHIQQRNLCDKSIQKSQFNVENLGSMTLKLSLNMTSTYCTSF